MNRQRPPGNEESPVQTAEPQVQSQKGEERYERERVEKRRRIFRAKYPRPRRRVDEHQPERPAVAYRELVTRHEAYEEGDVNQRLFMMKYVMKYALNRFPGRGNLAESPLIVPHERTAFRL